MIVRPPVVAGTFYNLHPETLKNQIENCFKHRLGPGLKFVEDDFLAAIVPHAGYAYSGPIASWVYSRIKRSNYIILGPNHSGIGPVFSVFPKGIWKTPLGSVEIDGDGVKQLVSSNPLLEVDTMSHEYEHSIEVQLPFLQYRFGNEFRIIPISVLNYTPSFDFLEECKSVAKTISDFIKNSEESWVVIASSDFTHYQPHEYAKRVDMSYIESIEKLDAKDFFVKLQETKGSVCGFGPIAIAIFVSKFLKGRKGELLKYATSGDVTGDYSSVVGYASIKFV
ncbi:MAG: MEMO1 family protein [Candidatus Aenigmarchaeota archaeon]|nr:MEMO1 family protein [Candidatus Aenigmarchaeota archaeon]